MATGPLSRGVFPSDIVLRSALLRGLNDLRLRSYLIDDIFAPMSDDDETRDVYGQAQADQAKTWFLNTDVPIRIADSPEPPTATGIAVSLGSGGEDALTLADVHSEPTAADDRVWANLAGPVDPVSYDPATGLVVLPDSVTLVIVPGMVVVDREGHALPVTAAPAPHVLQLAAGTRADLRGMVLRGARPARAVTLGSLLEQESYQIDVTASGEAVYLSYLFAIVKYVLYRARRDLESRGMERVRYSSSGPERDGTYAAAGQAMWTRTITASLVVRQTWVQDEESRIYSVQPAVNPGPVGGAIDLDVDVLSGVSG